MKKLIVYFLLFVLPYNFVMCSTSINYYDIDYSESYRVPSRAKCEKARREGKDYYHVFKQLLLVSGGVEEKREWVARKRKPNKHVIQAILCASADKSDTDDSSSNDELPQKTQVSNSNDKTDWVYDIGRIVGVVVVAFLVKRLFSFNSK